MATSVASNVFNAFAFAGASWVMSKIDHGDYVKEVKRHDLAMEQLQKERNSWNEKRLQELYRLSQLHYQEHESKEDIADTNKDLASLLKLRIGPKPQLQDYYKPSNTMEEYITFVKFAVAIPAAYMLLLLI